MFLPDEYLAVREAVWLVARWAERRELSDGLAGDGEGAASVVIAQKLAGGHLAALAWVADGRFFQLPATFWRTAQVFDTLDAGEISFPPDYGVPPVKLLIPKADLERALGVRSVAGMGDLPSDGMSSRAQPVLALHVGPGVGAVAETLLNHQLDALGLPRGLPKRRPKVRLATPEEVEFFEAKGRQALQDWWENLPRPPFTPSATSG